MISPFLPLLGCLFALSAFGSAAGHAAFDLVIR